MMQTGHSHPEHRLGLQLQDPLHALADTGIESCLERVRAQSAGWVYVRLAEAASLPLNGLELLAKSGVQPIVHFPIQLTDSSPSHLNPKLRQLAAIGVRHVIAFDQPNMKQAWAGTGWHQQSLTERFLDRMAPVLQASLGAGLVPTLPPLEPGGDYWDLAFLEAVLGGVARRMPAEVLNTLTLTAYLRPHSRAADWGKGGPKAWPQARPYFTPEGHQDHLGLNLPDWYEAVAHKVLRRSLPQLAIVQMDAPAAQPSPSHSIEKLAVRLVEADDMPQIRAACFEQLPELPNAPATVAAKQPHAPQNKSADAEPIEHYLLLPTDGQQSIRLWRQVSAFAIHTRATVGFSTEEATRAARVTLAGDTDALPTALEAKLRLSGCQVQRLTEWPKSIADARAREQAEATPDLEVAS